MSGAPERAEIRRFLLASLRGRRRELLVLSGWALAEGLPAYLSGRLEDPEFGEDELRTALDHLPEGAPVIA